MRALIAGASGELATAVGRKLLADGWELDLLTREVRREAVQREFSAALAAGRATLATVPTRYSAHAVSRRHDAVFMMQGLFEPRALADTDASAIDREIEAGLCDLIRHTAAILAATQDDGAARRDFCYIGSTSSYAGFRNTAVYCAVKHGLLGFVRAMNDEYGQTGTRFWLFSMGTMDTAMGRKVTGQDRTTYLDPGDVAARIVAAMSSNTNVFEPEVLLRRRTIRFTAG